MVGFSKLWQSYPDLKHPCRTNGSPNFTNQCAIRMAVCLEEAGVSTNRLNVTRCWYHPPEDGHILRAEELAKALSSGAVAGVGRIEKYKGTEAFPKIQKRTGIIFIENFYGSGLQGDHIDLWNGAWTTAPVTSLVNIWRGKYQKGNVWFWRVL